MQTVISPVSRCLLSEVKAIIHMPELAPSPPLSTCDTHTTGYLLAHLETSASPHFPCWGSRCLNPAQEEQKTLLSKAPGDSNNKMQAPM